MILSNHSFEVFALTLNNRDNNMPKGITRCENIGITGGCGLRCSAFCDGECENPQEFKVDDILDEFSDEEYIELKSLYPNIWE